MNGILFIGVDASIGRNYIRVVGIDGAFVEWERYETQLASGFELNNWKKYCNIIINASMQSMRVHIVRFSA